MDHATPSHVKRRPLRWTLDARRLVVDVDQLQIRLYPVHASAAQKLTSTGTSRDTIRPARSVDARLQMS